jgi:hypothetical protein
VGPDRANAPYHLKAGSYYNLNGIQILALPARQLSILVLQPTGAKQSQVLVLGMGPNNKQ